MNGYSLLLLYQSQTLLKQSEYITVSVKLEVDIIHSVMLCILSTDVTMFLLFVKVSWIRKDESHLHILTIGKSTFSADDRYSLSLQRKHKNRRRHQKKESSNVNPVSSGDPQDQVDNWRLKIKPSVRGDNGTYYCQVSTHPPIVLVTHLEIIGKRINRNLALHD